MGLRSIKNRITLWDGSFELQSEINEGTKLKIKIPMQELLLSLT